MTRTVRRDPRGTVRRPLRRRLLAVVLPAGFLALAVAAAALVTGLVRTGARPAIAVAGVQQPAPASLAGTVRSAATPTPSPRSPLGPDRSIDVQVTGLAGIPDTGVDAVVATVTAVDATAESYLTVWPAGAPRPLASSLNPGPRRTVANTVVARVGDGGRISIYNRAGRVHVLVDVLGWVAAGGGLVTTTPARAFDSRTLAAVRGGESFTVPIAGRGAVPAGVAAAVVNLTATDATASSYVTAWANGGVRPTASNLNPVSGRTVANLAIVPLGADGAMALYNNAGSVHLVVDVLGWLAPSAGYVGVAPVRLVDTRTPPGSGPLGPDAHLDVALAAGAPAAPAAGEPAAGDPVAMILNVTATDATAETFLTAWPAGGERPATSSLNPGPGPALANTSIVGIGAAPAGGGAVSVYNHNGSVHVVADLLGTLTAPSGVHPVAPARVFDTRPPEVPHAFPVALTVTPRPSYVHDHHDYPATDIFANCGSPVLTPVAGTVSHVRRTDSYDAAVGNPATLGGRSIAIVGDDGVRYYASHVESFVAGIAVGVRVTAGQPIAVLGRTGDAGACHVHFGISPPCPGPEWQVRRGVIWPGDYLDSWRAGGNRGPADEIGAWSAAHPTACADAMALPTAAQAEDPPTA